MPVKSDRAKVEMDVENNLLTVQERQACEQIAAGNAPHSQRAQALLALDEGVTQSEAGSRAALTVGQVRYWLGRFRQRRLEIFPADELELAAAQPVAAPAAAARSAEPLDEADKRSKKKAKKKKKSKKTKGQKKKS
jgi:DNA-directed RNA polymerase specialized sigma24 family protein